MAIKEGKKLHTFGSGFSPSICHPSLPVTAPAVTRGHLRSPQHLPITQGTPVGTTPARAEGDFSARALSAGRHAVISIRALTNTAQAGSG